jgi:hypothetical protein
MNFDYFETDKLPMKRGRVIKTLSDSTIRGILDAIVELVTNSDDSYTRLESKGRETSGIIKIFLTRTKGGHCTFIRVIDEAEGMSFQSLKKSIEFSGETSGFKEGGTVRGFFGRGLKESIIALGKGSIFTLKDSVLCNAEIYYDSKEKDAIYKLATPIKGESEEELKNLGFNSRSGSIVEIKITNTSKDNIPSSKIIDDHISKHYSLRDICASKKRKIELHFSEPDNKGLLTKTLLSYQYPKGELVFDKPVNISGDNVYIKIYESEVQLDSPVIPQGTAGLMIKSEGSILDNKLFGFENEPSGLYFYGEVNYPGIAKAIRNGDESIVDYNRGGLDWRHISNKELERKIKQILKILVDKKREEIVDKGEQEVKQPIQKLLNDICQELSKMAKDELEDTGPAPGQLNSLIIIPMVANLEPDKPRNLGVYAPRYLIEEMETHRVEILSSNSNIHIINSSINLNPHKTDKNAAYSSFKVVGNLEGESAIITAKLNSKSATCEVRVQEQKERPPSGKPKKSGGIFNKIIPAQDEEPTQRFQYIEGGIIKVFVKFPGINKYLGDNFENIDTVEGKMVLAEIIIEAFCRYIASQRAGKIYDEEIYPYLSDMDRLRRKVSSAIYLTILKTNLNNLVEK